MDSRRRCEQKVDLDIFEQRVRDAGPFDPDLMSIISELRRLREQVA